MSLWEAGVVAIGPLTNADGTQSTLDILGQTAYVVDESILASVALGDYVVVRGFVTGFGEVVATSVDRLDAQYVPGSSPIFVAGVIAESNHKRAIVKVGNLTIDYTATLHSYNPTKLGFGRLVVLSGVQPVDGGQVLVNDISSYE